MTARPVLSASGRASWRKGLCLRDDGLAGEPARGRGGSVPGGQGAPADSGQSHSALGRGRRQAPPHGPLVLLPPSFCRSPRSPRLSARQRALPGLVVAARSSVRAGGRLGVAAEPCKRVDRGRPRCRPDVGLRRGFQPSHLPRRPELTPLPGGRGAGRGLAVLCSCLQTRGLFSESPSFPALTH